LLFCALVLRELAAVSMAGSINTASLLLVAMLVSTVLAFPVLSEDPQLASSSVSYPSVTASQLGDVQDITATDDGSLETAALGNKGKQQERYVRMVASQLPSSAINRDPVQQTFASMSCWCCRFRSAAQLKHYVQL
jgi:hypothetical protein